MVSLHGTICTMPLLHGMQLFFKESSKSTDTDARRYDRVSYRWFLSVVIKFPLSKLNVPLRTALTLLSLKSVAAQTLQFCNFGVVQKNQTAI